MTEFLEADTKPNRRQTTLYYAVQTRFHRDSSGHIRADHGYARYEAWRAYLGVVHDVVLLARVSSEVKDTGVIVEGVGVSVLPVPFYKGPRDFVLKARSITRFLDSALVDSAALYGARVPDVLGVLVQRRARSIGARFFAQVVGDPEDVLRGGALGILGRVLAPVAKTFVARNVRKADGVIYVTRRTLQAKYPPRVGVPTLSRSNVELQTESFSATPRDYIDFPAAQPMRLITAGSQEQTYKGHDVLIDAVAMLRSMQVPVHASIIGGGKFHEALRAQAQQAGVADAVSFVGHLSGSKLVLDEIRKSDLFVLPSRTEGLSRVLIEAMASGIACIGSNVGGTPELLPADSLFESDSPSELADLVARLSDHPSEMTAIAAAGWSTAHEISESFSGPRILDTFLESMSALRRTRL